MQVVGRRLPGAAALEEAAEALVTNERNLFEVGASSLPPLFMRYYRQQLAGRMPPAMSREAQTLTYILDALLRGRAAESLDVAAQRLKALEMHKSCCPGMELPCRLRRMPPAPTALAPEEGAELRIGESVRQEGTEQDQRRQRRREEGGGRQERSKESKGRKSEERLRGEERSTEARGPPLLTPGEGHTMGVAMGGRPHAYHLEVP